MDIHVQLEDRVAPVDDLYRSSGNVFLNELLGATVHRDPAGEDEAAADARLDELADELRDNGAVPYVIHLGTNHPPLGALGYVDAAAELAEQVDAQVKGKRRGIKAVVVPSGSGLTHCGLLVGLRANSIRAPVHGICVRRDAEAQTARIHARSLEVQTLIERSRLIRKTDIRLHDSVLAPGYGQLSEAVCHAMALAARLEGLVLDPVYSAKAMAGLIALCDDKTIEPGSRVIFIHTGGQPALFGYQGMLTSYATKAMNARDGE